jgi:ATP-dependent DNA helicase RecG
MYESETVEFKIIVNDDMSKEVISFANSKGGTIFVGIDDRGNEIGLLDIDESYTRLTNIIRDTVLPDITMFIRYEFLNRKIIKISVAEGSAKPYYLKQKGMKPSGVYVRQGASSVQASWEQIRQLIKNADGDSYESTRSINQDLSFSVAENEFQNRSIAFSEEKYVSLGIWDAEMKLFTNLALLLSDQCAHSVKVAVFDDTANTVFIDRREYVGSVFKQLHDTYDYLMLNNKIASEIRGLDRFDLEDYPPEAIREALLNALVHRDYSFSGSIIININREKIEFINLGGLLPGLSEKDIMSGISQPRNAKLAQIFFRLKHIEAYGTGIRRIFDLYRQTSVSPEIAVSDNTFRMTLPNRNFHLKNKNQSIAENQKMTKTEASLISPQMQTILDYLNKHMTITNDGIMVLLNLKRTRAYLIAKQMLERGLIDSHGRGQGKVYKLHTKGND